jgi:hypothetical protein
MNFRSKIAVVMAAVIGATLFVAGPTFAQTGQTGSPQMKPDTADASKSSLAAPTNPSTARSSTVAESPEMQASGPKAAKAANPVK